MDEFCRRSHLYCPAGIIVGPPLFSQGWDEDQGGPELFSPAPQDIGEEGPGRAGHVFGAQGSDQGPVYLFQLGGHGGEDVCQH